jgi:hypothetical protein
MTFDDLQHAWQQSNESAAHPPDDANALLRTVRRVEKSKSKVFRRDWIETIVALLLIYWFGKDLFDLNIGMVWVGNLVCVGGMIFIIFKLHTTRWVWGTSRLDLTVREYCDLELRRVEKQIALLRSVAIWYLAPCFLGVNLVFAGLTDSFAASFGYFIFVLLLYWGIYLLNQFAVDKHFVPLYEELQAARIDMNVDLDVNLDVDDAESQTSS